MKGWTHDLPTEADAQDFARLFSGHILAPMVVYLKGDLGAGKTTFARAYIHGLGYKGYVKSPSYGLLETYTLESIKVLHLDLYRIEDPEELEYLALRDLFDDRSVLLVEWPDRGGSLLPAPDLVLEFGEKHEARFVTISAKTPAGQQLSRHIQEVI